MHAADRTALRDWLGASSDLDGASARYEGVRRAEQGARRRVSPAAGATRTGTGGARTYPVDPGARARLIRRGRPDAVAIRAVEARRTSTLAAGSAEVQMARARLAAATSALRAQIPWAGAIIDLRTRGDRRR